MGRKSEDSKGGSKRARVESKSGGRKAKAEVGEKKIVQNNLRLQ